MHHQYGVCSLPSPRPHLVIRHLAAIAELDADGADVTDGEGGEGLKGAVQDGYPRGSKTDKEGGVETAWGMG